MIDPVEKLLEEQKDDQRVSNEVILPNYHQV